MEVFLKVLKKMKKPEPEAFFNCKYNRGWNDAIKKVEELITSYSVSDMWIPVGLRLPPEPDDSICNEDWLKYNVTISGAELPTTLTYLGDGKWGAIEKYGIAYYPVDAWQPMPEVYKVRRK